MFNLTSAMRLAETLPSYAAGARLARGVVAELAQTGVPDDFPLLISARVYLRCGSNSGQERSCLRVAHVFAHMATHIGQVHSSLASLCCGQLQLATQMIELLEMAGTDAVLAADGTPARDAAWAALGGAGASACAAPSAEPSPPPPTSCTPPTCTAAVDADAPAAAAPAAAAVDALCELLVKCDAAAAKFAATAEAAAKAFGVSNAVANAVASHARGSVAEAVAAADAVIRASGGGVRAADRADAQRMRARAKELDGKLEDALSDYRAALARFAGVADGGQAACQEAVDRMLADSTHAVWVCEGARKCANDLAMSLTKSKRMKDALAVMVTLHAACQTHLGKDHADTQDAAGAKAMLSGVADNGVRGCSDGGGDRDEGAPPVTRAAPAQGDVPPPAGDGASLGECLALLQRSLGAEYAAPALELGQNWGRFQTRYSQYKYSRARSEPAGPLMTLLVRWQIPREECQIRCENRIPTQTRLWPCACIRPHPSDEGTAPLGCTRLHCPTHRRARRFNSRAASQQPATTWC